MKTLRYFQLAFMAMIFMCIGLRSSYAQDLQGQARADSLINELPKTKSDTDQVNLLVMAGRAVMTIDPAAAMNYINRALYLSQQHNWQKGIGLAYLNKARTYDVTSDFAAALDTAGKALEIFI